ncbi:MAG: iron chaperone [Actinomycetota bacterium]
MADAVDEYLAGLPKEQREALEGLRRTIRSAVPEVEEAIRSRVPAFRYKGRPLVSMGASKRHLSLFIMYGAVLEAHKDELRGFDTSNTVIRFWPDEPIPDHLVTKLVKARKAELDA